MSRKIFDQFNSLLKERSQRGHFAEITFIGINKADIKEHNKNGNILNVTVNFVAEVITGSPGKYVELEDTIKSFDSLVKGEYDHMPEAAFYMVGGIEEAIEKAKKLEAEAA